MTDTVAASLIPQIIVEHEAITSVVGKAYQTALEHGIKCGEFLTLAKETVTKAKLSWQAWLIKNLPFPQTTASLYMRLYENREFLAGISSNVLLGAPGSGWGDFSIRRANELIKAKAYQERTPEEKKKAEEKEAKAKATKERNEADKAGVAAPDKSGSIDLEDLLPNSGPDEVFDVIKDSWLEEDLTALAKLLADHLAKLKVPSPKAPDDPIRRLPPTDPRPPSRP